MMDEQTIKGLIRQRILDVIAPAEPPNWTLVIAAVAAYQTMSVDVVRITHEVRSVQVTCMGQVVAESIVTGAERIPALGKMFLWRKMLGIEMEG